MSIWLKLLCNLAICIIYLQYSLNSYTIETGLPSLPDYPGVSRILAQIWTSQQEVKISQIFSTPTRDLFFWSFQIYTLDNWLKTIIIIKCETVSKRALMYFKDNGLKSGISKGHSWIEYLEVVFTVFFQALISFKFWVLCFEKSLNENYSSYFFSLIVISRISPGFLSSVSRIFSLGLDNPVENRKSTFLKL